MKKTLLISTFLVSILYHFQLNATELTDALRENKPFAEIQTLIKNGANVNQPDSSGEAPLIKALYIVDEELYNEMKEGGLTKGYPDYQSYVKNHLDIAEILLKNGADINVKNKYGENLLSSAMLHNSVQVVEFLLKNGMNPNTVNEEGMTPLMEAVSTYENADIVKTLLKYGANKEAQDKKGRTAASYAKFNPNLEIQNLLKVSDPVKKYNLSPSAEKYYSEMKEGILKEMVLPMVQNTVSDQTKVQSVMEKIEDSIDMDQVKSDTWPCLSKIPESKWNSAEKCFQNFMMDLMQKTVMFTALANGGENVDLNDKGATFSAIQKGTEVVGNKAMVKHYANSLMTDISIISIIAKAANGGEGKDVSSDEADDLKNKKIACGAKLYGKKDGSVVIEFPNECARMEKSDERFDISVDEVIEAAKKDEYSLYTLSCTGHKCIGKFKN